MRKEVVCDLVKEGRVQPCEGKVVCDLKVYVAHVGNSCVECAYGVGVGPVGLDMMSSTELNTWQNL